MNNSDSKYETAPKGLKNEIEGASGQREHFMSELTNCYKAEKMVTQTVPNMINNACCVQLVELFTNYLEKAKWRLSIIDQVFTCFGEKFNTMVDQTEETEVIVNITEFNVVRHDALMEKAKTIEQNEIATYEKLHFFSKTLGEEEAASLIEEILIEDKIYR